MGNFVGEKFESLGADRYNMGVIVKRVRQDLKEAFGKEFKFGVRKRYHSGLDVNIKQCPKEMLVSEISDPETELRYTDQFKEEFINKIYQIVNAYNYDNSDVMSDYFDRNFYLDVKCRWWNVRTNLPEGTKII